MSLLEKCLILLQTYAKEEQYISKKYHLTRQFKHLVNNYFQTEKQVDFYSQKLNITSNHLNDVVKSQTNKTAKRHILDRTLLESKNLLRYTDIDIAEIAYSLNFSETTHFNRFFKKETQTTPKSYRLQNP
ncbi:MAG: helix-turn-helix domain-containing protein [Bacteroidota bacterium]